MSLRLVTEKFLFISEDLLFPKIGTGLLLATLPKFIPLDSVAQVFVSYGLNELYADKKAKRYWEKEEFVGPFCTNFIVNKMPLLENFRAVFGKEDIYFLVDQDKKKGFFIAEKENIVIATNYHRDAMPKLLKNLGIVLWGSTIKINPLGWQNLYELLTSDFLKNFPEVKRIEIISTAPGIRFKPPALQLEVALINFSSLEKIKEVLTESLKKRV
ncbi:MAG: hypothetical protein ABIK97_00715 [candidate division WOR-3 bacterium]